jgi:molybdopterin synthase sulfur carrier subunit
MKIIIRYFASLREKAGKSQEEILIENGKNLKDIYLGLSTKYGFPLTANEIKFSVNNDYVDHSVKLNENDVVVFIPPVAGG